VPLRMISSPRASAAAAASGSAPVV
jgi:hypothetical protein